MSKEKYTVKHEKNAKKCYIWKKDKLGVTFAFSLLFSIFLVFTLGDLQYTQEYSPAYNFLTTGKNYCNHITNLMWPASFIRRFLNEALTLLNTFSTMTCSLSLGGGYLICQTFVKHQKQYGLWPGSLKWYSILATFWFHPAGPMHLCRALWSIQAVYDLWLLATCIPYFLCERNKWQAWRLSPAFLFYSGVLPAELSDPWVL